MAVPESNLDEYDKEAEDVLGGSGAEPGEGPVPELEEDVNPTPPTSVPAEGPEEFGGLPPTAPAPPPEPVPEGALPPAPAASQPGTGVPGSEDLARKQGVLDVEKAKIAEATAARMAEDARQADEDARLERAEYLQRRQDAEADLNARIKAYESTKLTDPRERTNSVKSWLAVIFGGLGAGMRGDNHNTGLEALQKRWEDDTALQKANIAALRDNAVMARTRLEDVDAGRRTMLRDADARLVAKYNLALKQGEAQLRGQGVPQAQIDADARIVQLRKGQAAAKLQAQKDEDAHLLNQARIARLNAQAAREKAKAAGRGGGGVSRKQQLAENRETRAAAREERQDADDVMKEVNGAIKDFTAKGGVKDSLLHVKSAIDKVEADKQNPTAWVNLIDGMIRSNTGRAAIKAQYDLYVSHSHGTADSFESWLAKLRSGLPSAEQQQNLLSASKGTLANLQTEAKEFHDNFRENYDADSRLRDNPRAWEAYNRVNRTTFGTLPGYEAPKPPAAPAKKAAGGTTPAEDSAAVTWAKQHLSDPRARAILKANGAL